MQANRGRDTMPELAVRSRLHALGLRYRVATPLPFDRRRRADIFFSRAGLYVFIDGCYWHGCPEHFVEPKTNVDFWRTKIDGNRAAGPRHHIAADRARVPGNAVLGALPTLQPSRRRYATDIFMSRRINIMPSDGTEEDSWRSSGHSVQGISSYGFTAARSTATSRRSRRMTVPTYLHLTTFGSDDRAVQGKSSQSFQLNAKSARALVEIIESTFGLNRA